CARYLRGNYVYAMDYW
nr:immunoglobulin heavy chain junction region [Mus musculus]MBK4185100.1 immunoglobulin heavy chain junction region [Mus musculus]